MMSEADQIAYAIKMSLQGEDTASEAETPNADSSRETTPMDTDMTRTSMVSFWTWYRILVVSYVQMTDVFATTLKFNLIL